MTLDRRVYIAQLKAGLEGKPQALKDAVGMSINRIMRMTDDEWEKWVEENRVNKTKEKDFRIFAKR